MRWVSPAVKGGVLSSPRRGYEDRSVPPSCWPANIRHVRSAGRSIVNRCRAVGVLTSPKHTCY